MNDIEFEGLLKRALVLSAELDYMGGLPSDSELSLIIHPSKRLTGKMSNLIRNPKSYIKKTSRTALQRFLHSAAIAVIVISMLFGVSMLNPTVRAFVTDFVRSWFDTHTRYEIINDEAAIIPTNVVLEYVPNGFELVLEEYDSTGVVILYESDIEEIIEIDILGTSDGKIYADNEHYDFYTIKADNYIVDVYESNYIEKYPNSLVCYDEDKNLLISIVGDLEIEEILNILKYMRFN